jgi:hypothetical protein
LSRGLSNYLFLYSMLGFPLYDKLDPLRGLR